MAVTYKMFNNLHSKLMNGILATGFKTEIGMSPHENVNSCSITTHIILKGFQK